MKTVKFDATVLTDGQRRRLADQTRLVSSMKNVISQQVVETLQRLEEFKEQGFRPQRIWFLERQESGTTSVAEWMGY